MGNKQNFDQYKNIDDDKLEELCKKTKMSREEVEKYHFEFFVILNLIYLKHVTL